MSEQTPAIEIFRPGSFTAVDGENYEFTRDDLLASVAAYDAEGEPAPIVIGHPKLDDPAYGWISSIELDGDIMVANPRDLEPAFAEAVREKRYARVSASWYPPGHPSNPKPGVWYLRHVGFLGAAAPAVRGLKPVSFSEEQAAGAVVFDLEPTTQEKPMPSNPEDKTADFAEREAAIARREADIAAREAELKAQAAKARHDAAVSFAEAQVDAGKLAPAGKDLVVGILDNLEAVQTVDFGEGTGELSPAAAFKKLFDGAHKLVSFGEHAGRPDEGGQDTVVDPKDAQAIAKAAIEFADSERLKGRIVSSAAAVRHVTNKGVK